jgi:hypothetical protein
MAVRLRLRRLWTTFFITGVYHQVPESAFIHLPDRYLSCRMRLPVDAIGIFAEQHGASMESAFSNRRQSFERYWKVVDPVLIQARAPHNTRCSGLYMKPTFGEIMPCSTRILSRRGVLNGLATAGGTTVAGPPDACRSPTGYRAVPGRLRPPG